MSKPERSHGKWQKGPTYVEKDLYKKSVKETCIRDLQKELEMSIPERSHMGPRVAVLRYYTLCVLQCVAVCCSVLQCVAVCCSTL